MSTSRCEIVSITEEFKWIKSIISYENPFPFFCKTYSIDFRHYLSSDDRNMFEKFLSEFYDVKKGQHQFICCWQELGMTVIVFKSL